MTVSPTDARPAEGELRIGHVFRNAWTVFSANFLIFFTISAIVALPYLLLQVALASDSALLGPSPAPDAFDWRVFIGWLLAMVLNLVAQAVILYVAFRYLRGLPAPIGDAVRTGLAHLFPVLGVVILLVVGAGVGFLTLIVPGIILLMRWSVAVPACVVEGLGPMASLGRSFTLTKGHGWQIFGISLLIWIASSIVTSLLGLVTHPIGTTAELIADFLWTAVWTAYFNSVMVIVYHDLRVAKEGVDVDQIAAVFD
jgi:hypothetical protein